MATEEGQGNLWHRCSAVQWGGGETLRDASARGASPERSLQQGDPDQVRTTKQPAFP